MRVVLVMSLKSFDDFTIGDRRWVHMDERIANLIVMYYLRLMWDPVWEEPCPSPE